MRLVFATLLLFLAPQLLAQTTTNPTNPTTPNTTNQSQLWSVRNASNVTGLLNNEINTAVTTIHGGLAGLDTAGDCASATPNSTCNNCSAGTDPCNTTRIHNELILYIEFRPASTSTALPGGPVFVTNNADQSSGNQKALTIVSQTPAGNIIPGNVTNVTVGIRWGEICEKIFDADPDDECDDPGLDVGSTQQLRIGINENNDANLDEITVNEAVISLSTLNVPAVDLCKSGSSTPPVTAACNFVAYPGDSKAFIQGVKTDCSFPSVSGSTVEKVRVFYEKYTDATTVETPDSSSPKTDLTLSGSGACSGGVKEARFVNNEVTGLENGATYRFSLGLLDQANNLGGIINMTTNIDPEDTQDCYTVDASYPLNCHTASPDEVIALIEKEFDCFITTATYGTPFRPQVEDFRAFRNQYLHSSFLGRKLIQFYYDVSPPIATWIRNNPSSKPFMRAILWPFWIFAKLSLMSPFLFLFMLLCPVAGIYFYRRNSGVKS